MASFRKTTLRDVARRAGVSPTTVSEYLSGQPNACSVTTARRIQQAVEELHYAPSALGASLRKAATRTLGLSLLFPRVSQPERGSFLLRVWEGVTKSALSHQYSILFYDDTIRRDLDNYRIFLDGRVDGVIFQPATSDTRPVRLAEAGLPVAVISARQENYPGCIALISDEDEIAEVALGHLWELGHRRIAHFAGPVSAGHEAGTSVAASRSNAYLKFCRRYGIEDPALWYSPVFWNPNTAADVAELEGAIERWRNLSEPPTAIFCVTDPIALRIIEYTARIGWKVPEQLSIIGVDNTVLGEWHRPALTTVAYPMEEQGQQATALLLAQIAGEPAPMGTVILGGARLIARETTAPPPN